LARVVVKFDLSSVGIRNVTKATLGMYVTRKYSSQYTASGKKGAYALTKAWEPSSVTWTKPWSKAGGDFNASGNIITSPGEKQWDNFDVTEAVKQAVQDPSSNNGFIIRFEASTGSPAVLYASSIYKTADKRPILTIEGDMTSVATPKVNNSGISVMTTSQYVKVSALKNSTVSLFDMQGKTIFAANNVSNSISIPLAKSNAAYILKVTGINTNFTQKIVPVR